MMMFTRTPLLFAALLLLFLFPASVPAADKPVDVALDKLEEARKAGDAQAIIRAVSVCASYQDSRVDRALKRVAGGKSPDKACAAAARALGLRGGSGNLAFLTKLVKRHRDRPYALLGEYEALGYIASPRSVETLYREATYFMVKQEQVTVAAIKALGEIRCPKAVERLIKILSATRKRQGWGPNRQESAGPTSSEDATRLASYQPVLIACLQKLTGVGLEDIDDWNNWWRDEKRRFRCPKIPPNPNRRLLYRNPAEGFEIMRPGPDWTWTEKPEGGFNATCRRRNRECDVAWVSIHVHSIRKEDPVSVSGMLDRQKSDVRRIVTSIGECEWNGQIQFAGVRAVRQEVSGQVAGSAGKLTQAIFQVKDMMYVVRWVVVSHASEDVESETKRMIESFKLVKIKKS